jgi:hypothetical protein
MSDKKLKSNEHSIITLQDMINCTHKDNLDAFIVDLRKVIEISHSLRDIIGGNDNFKNVSEGFIWIDDGKHNMKVNVGFKEKEE